MKYRMYCALLGLVIGLASRAVKTEKLGLELGLELEAEPVGCKNPANEGLVCFRTGKVQELGVCQQLSCSPLPCEVDDDCNDRSNDPCRVFTCQSDGACLTQAVNSGFECSHPAGGTGLCAAGTCI